MKKVLSLVLALVMVLALAVPAFASEPKTDITSGGAQVPPIEVIVPATASYVLNPYAMSLKISDDGSEILNEKDADYGTATATAFTDQIMSNDVVLVNTGITAIKGTVSATATPDGNAKLATKTLVGDTKTVTNSIFLQLSIGKATPTVSGDGTSGDPYVVDSATSDYTSATDLTLAAKAVTGTFTIAAPDGSTFSGVALKLKGDAVKTPTTPWTATDNVAVALTYKFEPTAE